MAFVKSVSPSFSARVAVFRRCKTGFWYDTLTNDSPERVSVMSWRGCRVPIKINNKTKATVKDNKITPTNYTPTGKGLLTNGKMQPVAKTLVYLVWSICLTPQL